MLGALLASVSTTCLLLATVDTHHTPHIALSVEHGLAATSGRTHQLSTTDKSLAAFMKQSPDLLAVGLKRRLPSNLLDVFVAREEHTEPSLVFSSSKRVYIGPRAFGLWVQPKMLLWVRSRRQSRVECDAAYIAGELARGVALSRLSVRTTLTWVESAIDHLQGDAVPCLLMKSSLALELAHEGSESAAGVLMKPPAWRLLSLIPPELLRRACARSLSKTLAEFQAAIGTALVESYEEWCAGGHEDLYAEAEA